MDRKKAGVVCAARHCKNKKYSCNLSFFTFPKDLERAKVWVMACGREDLLEDLEDLFKSHRLCGAHFKPKMFLNDLRNRLHRHAVPTLFPSLEGSSSSEHSYCAPPMQEVGTEPQTEQPTEIEHAEQQRLGDSAAISALPEESTDLVEERQQKFDELVRISNHSEIYYSTEESLTSSVHTQTPLSLTSGTPREKKLRGELQQLKKENERLQRENTYLREQSTVCTKEQFKELCYKMCTPELANFIVTQMEL